MKDENTPKTVSTKDLYSYVSTYRMDLEPYIKAMGQVEETETF